MRSYFRLDSLFASLRPVDRRQYVTVGLVLMLVKYVGEWLLVRMLTGGTLTVVQFVHPLLSGRYPLAQAEAFDLVLLALWSVPFLWIGVSMSMRRAVDAGAPAWVGALFVVPLANWVLMLVLSLLPSSPTEVSGAAETATASGGDVPDSSDAARALRQALLAAVVVGGAGAALFALGPGLYGSALFLGVPFVIGFAVGQIYNRGVERSVAATLGVTLAGLALVGGALLLLAIEGALCILMSLPIAVVLGALGAMMGRRAALTERPSGGGFAALVLVMLPGMAVVDSFEASPTYEARTAVIIDAPPERVWRHVVAFPALAAPGEPWFRAGIAYPVAANIAGSGVGAVRTCSFSTGDFVEPITGWDPPRRLAFDVAFQPLPMTELSPFARLHTRHLGDYLSSRRGEFRLVPLAGGRTRLEGSTWYQLRIYPGPYWRIYSDALIGSIHRRVLDHVRVLAEADPEKAGGPPGAVGQVGR